MNTPRPSARPRIALAAGVLLLTVAVGACGTSASPAPASEGPAATGGGPTPPPGGSTEVTVTARNLAFEPAAVAAPAGQPLTLVLDNRDNGVPHDLALTVNGSTVKTEIITGPARTSVAVGPLDAGSYPFVCEIHPNMTGTLVVGE